MMAKIQQGYINVISGYAWMADTTKNYLIDKISSITTNIAYPNKLRENPKELEKFYEKVQ